MFNFDRKSKTNKWNEEWISGIAKTTNDNKKKKKKEMLAHHAIQQYPLHEFHDKNYCKISNCHISTPVNYDSTHSTRWTDKMPAKTISTKQYFLLLLSIISIIALFNGHS